jgi:amino acid transporter
VVVGRTFGRSPASGKKPGYRREIGLMALTFVSLGSIIGSGWLLAASTGASSAGGGGSTLSWVLAGVMMVPLALVHAELGAAYPFTGGTASWPRLAFGSLAGFTAGWAAWLQAVATGPIEVEASLDYLNHKQPGLINNAAALTPTGLGVAAALMLLFTVINILGVRWLVKSNTITVLLKVAVPVLTIVALFTVSFRISNFTAGGGFTPYGAHGVLAALPLGVVFALNGFEQATQMGGEARDPQRNIPRAVIGAVVVSTVLYLALQFSFIGALNPVNLVQGWSNPLGNGDVALYSSMVASLGVGWLVYILTIDAFVSPAGAALVYMGASSRLSYALGHAGYVPRGFSLISGRGVPYFSIILTFLVGLGFLFAWPSWQSLVSLITLSTAIMYAFAPITLVALRKADPERVRPYRLRAASALAPVAFIAANEIIYWTSWATVEKLMLAFVVGYMIFGTSYALGDHAKRSPLDLRSLVWILPWFAGLAVISYFGQYGGTKLIPEWVDLGVVAAFSLVVFYVAVQYSLPSQRVVRAVEAEEHGPVDYPRTRLVPPVVRQLRYGQRELAVLDASVKVVAVNWTARVGPTAFVSEADRLNSLKIVHSFLGGAENTRVILSVSSDPGIQHTTMSGLRALLADAAFEGSCDFVRVDLSTTQSAFWERLPNEGLAVVGFAGETNTFTEDSIRLVGDLLAATAGPAIDSDEVLSSLRRLKHQYANL